MFETFNDDIERLCGCGLSLPEPGPQRLEGAVTVTVIVLLDASCLQRCRFCFKIQVKDVKIVAIREINCLF